MSSELVRNYSDGEASKAIEMLARGAMDACPQLNLLCDDVAATVKRLDDRVARVTIAGECAYERAE
jgi:hypothetical protein